MSRLTKGTEKCWRNICQKNENKHGLDQMIRKFTSKIAGANSGNQKRRQEMLLEGFNWWLQV